MKSHLEMCALLVFSVTVMVLTMFPFTLILSFIALRRRY
jgi:hypothetical protein